MIKIARALSFGRELGSVLGGVMTEYVIFHLLFGSACTLWAIFRLRVLALRQASEPPRKIAVGRRERPAVGDDPIFWREVYVEGRGRTTLMTRLLIVGFGAMIVSVLGWMIADSIHTGIFMSPRFKEDVGTFVATFGTIIGCLLVLSCAIRASTCITSERDKDTFDFLLTTPLDSDAILWGSSWATSTACAPTGSTDWGHSGSSAWCLAA